MMSDHLNGKLFGTDLFGQAMEPEQKRGALHQRFLIPPFTVLNTREGVWQERRRAWLSLGIKSEEGRDGNMLGLKRAMESKEKYDGKAAEQAAIPAGLTFGSFKGNISGAKSGTSIFDPVLCECAYRWFCPPGGTVLDPFAGGSVRGVVAAMMGLQYFGFELRQEQVAANVAQGDEICAGMPRAPRWFWGDSREMVPRAGAADFVFSCPPYADLEKYSDDPRDLSNMPYDKFLEAYCDIIAAAAAKLLPNRFAAFVVGEVRDKRGHYRNFVGHTVQAFRRAGMEFYNEAILVNNAGTMPVRMNSQFLSGRKMGKLHQNLLVFVKGDPKAAAKACRWPGEVEEVPEQPADVPETVQAAAANAEAEEAA